ncbi:MAG: Sua5/YciO/YrdC/YwlC family protein, partial [Cyanobacteria bacterium J06636_27]
PDNAVCLSLLEALGNPIISTSAHIPNDDDDDDKWIEQEPLSRVELFDRMEGLVDVIIDTGKEPGYKVSTILDLTEEQPTVVRQGLGWEEVEEWM